MKVAARKTDEEINLAIDFTTAKLGYQRLHPEQKAVIKAFVKAMSMRLSYNRPWACAWGGANMM